MQIKQHNFDRFKKQLVQLNDNDTITKDVSNSASDKSNDKKGNVKFMGKRKTLTIEENGK